VFIDEAGSHTAMTRTLGRPKDRLTAVIAETVAATWPALAPLERSASKAVEGGVERRRSLLPGSSTILLGSLLTMSSVMDNLRRTTCGRRSSKHAVTACSTCHRTHPTFLIRLAFSRKSKGSQVAARKQALLTPLTGRYKSVQRHLGAGPGTAAITALPDNYYSSAP